MPDQRLRQHHHPARLQRHHREGCREVRLRLWSVCTDTHAELKRTRTHAYVHAPMHTHALMHTHAHACALCLCVSVCLSLSLSLSVSVSVSVSPPPPLSLSLLDIPAPKLKRDKCTVFFFCSSSFTCRLVAWEKDIPRTFTHVLSH